MFWPYKPFMGVLPPLNYQNINSITSCINTELKDLNTKRVWLSMTEVETKRIVLAFESRIPGEITWAINTLAIFSCNSSIPFTLDGIPFLLDSMCSYLTFAVQHCPELWAFTFHSLIQKLENRIHSSVPTITESAKPLSTSL